MSNSKNIDRLFKEKFKEFEATAPNNTWDNIQDSINKSKQNTQVKTATANNLYSTIFYVTASCFFITLTVALSTYAYITIKQDQVEANDAVVTLVDQTTDRKKQVIQEELAYQSNLLDTQLKNRNTNANLVTEAIITKKTTKPIVANLVNTIPVVLPHVNKLSIIPTEVNEYNFIETEHMIVDESVGKIIDDEDYRKIHNSNNVTEANVVVTSGGNRVLRVNTNQKGNSNQIKNISTSVDSTYISADELRLINQNKKRLKTKH